MDSPTYEIPLEPNRTAIYVRTSTNRQDSGADAQKKACSSYCEVMRWNDSVAYYIDMGYSGAAMHRPALARLREDIEAGKVDRVVVHSFSRLFRSVVDLIYTVNEFKKRGVEFISLTERLDTNTPFGKAMLAIIGTMAELERDLCSERIKMGLAAARKRGKKLGGYRGSGSGKLTELQEERMYFLRSRGSSLKELARLYGLHHSNVLRILKRREEKKQAMMERVAQAG